MTSAAWLALAAVCFASAAGVFWVLRVLDERREYRCSVDRLEIRLAQSRAAIAAVTDGATALDDGSGGARVWSVPEAAIEAAFRARYDEASEP